MRRFKRKIVKTGATVAGVTMAAVISAGTAFGAAGVNTMAAETAAQDSADNVYAANTANEADEDTANSSGNTDNSGSSDTNRGSLATAVSNKEESQEKVMSATVADNVTLNSISFSENEIIMSPMYSGHGAVVTITADVSDPDKVERINVQLVNETTGDFERFSLENGAGIIDAEHIFNKEGIYRLYFAEVEIRDGDSVKLVTYGEGGDYPFDFSVPTVNVREPKAKINSLKFDKTEAEPGEYIYLTVDIETEADMAVDYYDITLENENGDIIEDAGSTNGKPMFAINKNTPTGVYHISSINLSMSNYMGDYNYHKAFSEEDIKNISDKDTLTVLEGDRTPPVINSVNVTPSEISLSGSSSGSVTIQADVTDSESGIENVIVTVKDPEGNEETYSFWEYSVGYNPSKELYFDHGSKNGTYEITQVTVRDNGGNEATKTISEKFTVKDSREDTEGPIVSEIRFSKSVARPGDRVYITVVAEDDSGLGDYSRIYLKDKKGKVRDYSLRKGENEILENIDNVIYVDDSWINGDYEVAGLSVTDKAGNNRIYGVNYNSTTNGIPDNGDNPLSDIPVIGDFAVENSKEDLIAPTVRSISFKLPDGKTVAEPGDEIEVIAEAEDNANGSGVYRISYNLENENGSLLFVNDRNIYYDENGILKGTFTIPSDADGNYSLEEVQVSDNAGNFRRYSDLSTSQGDPDVEYVGDISSNSFSVNGRPVIKEDTEAPVLKSLNIELPAGKTTAAPGDKVRVFAEATDNKSDSISIEINNFDPTSFSYMYLYKDETTGKYTGEVTITDKWNNGEYKINLAELNDYNSNYAYYYDKSYSSDVSAEKDLANIPGTKSFTVTGSKEDHQAPIVESVAITKINDTDGATVYTDISKEPYPQFSPGDKMVFSVRLSDESDVSNYNRLYIYLWDTNTRTETIYLTRQEDGTFSGETTVTDRWSNNEDGKHHNLRVYASDVLNNSNEDDLPLVGKIRIFGSKDDNDGPVLNSLSIDKQEAKPGDVITITADIKDTNSKGTPAGLDTKSVSGYLRFYSDGGDWEKIDYQDLNFEEQADGTFKAQITVDDSWYNYADNGNTSYKLYISASDIVSNGTYFDEDEIKKEVRISGSKQDRKGPDVTAVTFDKTEAQPGDTVKMSVTAEDESDIEEVYVVVYKEGNSEDDSFTPVRGRLNVKPDSAGELAANIRIDNSFKNGTYEVYSIRAKDVLANNKNYYRQDDGTVVSWEDSRYDDAADKYIYDKSVKVGEFTVKNSPGVYAGSALKSVTFAKSVYESGNKGHAKAELEDPNADVEYADINVGYRVDDGRGGGDDTSFTGEAPYVDGYEQFSVRLLPTEKGVLEGDFDVPVEEAEWDRLFGGSPTFRVLSALVADSNNNIMYYSIDDYVYDEETGEYVPGEHNIENVTTNTFVIDDKEEEKLADYTKVDEAIFYIPSALDKYTEESIDVLNEALKAVIRGKDASEQATVDAYAEAIQKAIDALVPKDSAEPAEYRRVDEAIARVPVDTSIYTEESLKAVTDAVNAVVRGKSIIDQPLVNDYARAINEAIRNLEKKPADYTQTDAAIASMPADTSVYTPESVEAAESAIAAVVRDKKIDEQADVDALTKAIEDAVAALVLKDADYSKVEEARTQVPSDEVLKDYTDESVQALRAAIVAVIEGKKADEQAIVDGYAEAIDKAISALEMKPADYSAVDAAKAAVPADLDKYTDDSVNALNDAINAVLTDKKINEQTTVDEYARAINVAVMGLELKPADYTKTDEAIAKLPKDTSVYTPESVQAVQDAISSVVRGKNINEQAEVDTFTKAIEDAIAALELKNADYSAVEAAKAKVHTDEELTKYTDDSVENLKAAVEAVVNGKKINEQSVVDGYAKAIEDAIAALVLKSDTASDNPVVQPGDNSGEPDKQTDNNSGQNAAWTDDNSGNDNKGKIDISDDTKAASSSKVPAASSGKTTPVASTGSNAAVRTGNPAAVTTSGSSNTVKATSTGDNNSTLVWILSAGASAAAALGAAVLRRRKKEDK